MMNELKRNTVFKVPDLAEAVPGLLTLLVFRRLATSGQRFRGRKEVRPDEGVVATCDDLGSSASRFYDLCANLAGDVIPTISLKYEHPVQAETTVKSAEGLRILRKVRVNDEETEQGI